MATLRGDSFTTIMKEGEKTSTTRLIGFELENAKKREFTLMMNQAKNFTDVGHNKIEEKPEGEWPEELKKLYDFENVAGWGYDGGGLEIMTQPYSINILKEGGDKNLRKLFEYIDKYFKPDIASGTHINISKLPTDSKHTATNLWWLSLCFGPELRKIFGRKTSWAMLPQEFVNKNAKTVGAVNALREITGTKPSFEGFTGMKARFVGEKTNRFEFRGAKATTNLEEALAWAELAFNMMQAASKDSIEGLKLSSLLEGVYLTKYIEEHCRTGERGLTSADFKKTINRRLRIKTSKNDRTVIYTD